MEERAWSHCQYIVVEGKNKVWWRRVRGNRQLSVSGGGRQGQSVTEERAWSHCQYIVVEGKNKV